MRQDQPTFAGGEIAPRLAARNDVAKYKTALRRQRNFLGQSSGGVTFRPGFEFVSQVYNHAYPARLIPFQFSPTQSYAIILQESWMNFVYRGGLITGPEVLVVGITNASPAVVTVTGHGFKAGQDVEFQGIKGMTEINGMVARIIAIIDANRFSVTLDTGYYAAFTGATGGVAASALPPPPNPASPPAPPPFEQEVPATEEVPNPPTEPTTASPIPLGSAGRVYSESYSFPRPLILEL